MNVTLIFLYYVSPSQENTSEKSELEKAFEKVFRHIEKNTVEPVLVSELKEMMGKNFPERRTFYRKLKKKFGKDILIAQHAGKETKIYYKNFNVDEMASNWLCGENLSDDKKLFLYNITAEILATDIRAAKFDNTFYPSPGDFFKNIKTDIPHSLNFFISKLLFFKNPSEKKTDP